MATKDSGSQEISVRVRLLPADGNETPPQAAAYVFSSEGRLLHSAPLKDDGRAVLKLPKMSYAADVRVLIGPAMGDQKPDLEELTRRGAQEHHVRVDDGIAREELQITVFSPVWLCWLRSACFVRGTLLKREFAGAITLDLPVCHATVDVYEVDPLWIIIDRLPDDVIAHLRDIIINPVPIPDPFPDPIPDPFRDRVPIPFPPPRPGPGPDPAPYARSAISDAITRRQSPQRFDAEVMATLGRLTEATELRYAAQVGAKLQFRDALLKFPQIVRPLICWFYPRFVTTQLVATAETDRCGHFQALFFRGCNNHDQPDLYFKARQRLFGFFDITIYAPTPIACHTWWDYACGSEVTLITTSPFAITCRPCPPVIGPVNWVLFTAIGNTSLKAIYGGGAVGVSSTNLGLLESGAPWGGTLRPRLDFDSNLRGTLGVKYYQLSWRKGTSGSWTPLDAAVNRHYVHFINGDPNPVVSPYPLGPNPMVVGGESLKLYEIPPALPPDDPAAVRHDRMWTVYNSVLDTENGEFDSVTHASGLRFDHDTGAVQSGTTDNSGLYQLRLELFDAAGVRVDIAAKGIHYVVPDSAVLAGTTHTVDANTVLQPGGGTLMDGNAMVLTLRIDNNQTWAGLAPPVTPTGAADACCGVVHYGSGASVSLPYTAYHPHGFADYGFNVFRSASKILSFSGGVGSYTAVETVADMMSLNRPPACLMKPVCTLAAFSEHLDVNATATDGWGSNLGYDSVADRAFALAPV